MSLVAVRDLALLPEVLEVLYKAPSAARGGGGEPDGSQGADCHYDLSDGLTHLAIARGHFIVIVRLSPPDHPDPYQLLECEPAADGVTALRWLDDDRLIAGFASGTIHVRPSFLF